MMVYVNGQDITRLVLGGIVDGDWTIGPEVLDVRPEQYLFGLDTWLTRHGLVRGDVSSFALVKGPGSATSLRTAHAMVNALAFAFGVQIVALEKPLDVLDADILQAVASQPAYAFALPAYTRDPNITATTRDRLKRVIA